MLLAGLVSTDRVDTRSYSFDSCMQRSEGFLGVCIAWRHGDGTVFLKNKYRQRGPSCCFYIVERVVSVDEKVTPIVTLFRQKLRDVWDDV